MLRILLLIGGALVLVILVVQIGPGEIVAGLSRIGWGLVPMSALYAGHQALRAWALRLSTSRPGAIHYLDALAVRFSGEAIQFLTSSGPFLAEPSKALLLARRGLTKTEGFAATIAEYLAYTFVSAAMLAVAVWYLATRPDIGAVLRNVAVGLLVVAVAFLVVSSIAVWRRIYVIGELLQRLSGLPVVGRRLAVDAAAVRGMEDLLLGVLRQRPRRVLLILLVEASAAAVLVVELWWILQVSEVASGFFRPLVLEAASKFTGLAFFFVPGQVGASEGVNFVMFRVLGLPAATGVSVALARRLRSAIAAMIGLTALTVLARGSRHEP